MSTDFKDNMPYLEQLLPARDGQPNWGKKGIDDYDIIK
jgi:hypothetical protein